MNPYETFTVVSPLVPGGLNPILPFLRGRSDAACRVVIKNVGLMGGGAWGMWRGWAGESLRCEDPAPTVGVCGDAIACRIAIQMPPFPPPPCAYHLRNAKIPPPTPPSPRIPCQDPNKPHINDAAKGISAPLGRALAGGRATFRPPLQHRPCQEHHIKTR